MPEIQYLVTGDRQVALKFDRFPQQAHDRLLARIQALTAELEARVLAAEPRRTGRLHSATISKVYDDQEKIGGRVTVRADFAKAAALEYGAHRPTKVAAHEMRLDHVFAERLTAPMTVMVMLHRRMPNIAAYRFLRGPLAQMAPEIQAELQAAVAEAAAESP